MRERERRGSESEGGGGRKQTWERCVCSEDGGPRSRGVWTDAEAARGREPVSPLEPPEAARLVDALVRRQSAVSDPDFQTRRRGICAVLGCATFSELLPQPQGSHREGCMGPQLAGAGARCGPAGGTGHAWKGQEGGAGSAGPDVSSFLEQHLGRGVGAAGQAGRGRLEGSDTLSCGLFFSGRKRDQWEGGGSHPGGGCSWARQ